MAKFYSKTDLPLSSAVAGKKFCFQISIFFFYQVVVFSLYISCYYEFDEWAITGVDVSKSEEHNPQFAPKQDGLTKYFAYCRLSLSLIVRKGPGKSRSAGFSFPSLPFSIHFFHLLLFVSALHLQNEERKK